MRAWTQFRNNAYPIQLGNLLRLAFISLGCLGALTNFSYAQSTEEPFDLTGATTEAVDGNIVEDPIVSNGLSQQIQGRQNLPAQRRDVTGSIRRSVDDGNPPGIRMGSFTLRPSVQSQIRYENEKTATTSQNRVYNRTTLGASLESDWSRHSLTIDGTGTIEKNISGTLNENPSAEVNADLELNLNELLTANIRGGYNFEVEDRTDPNAISNATSQANIHSFNGALALSKEIGIIRGSITGSLTKEIHGDATLANNTVISGNDRDFLRSGLALRLQFAANPVLMPFIEGEIGRTKYDQTVDSNGLKRSYSNYALRLGLQADISDKLAGEFSVGYVTNRFDDASLQNLNTFTVDSNLNWSPRRGTDATFGFATTIEPSTTAGVSGAALYALSFGLNQQITRRLSANVGAEYSLRKFTGTTTTADQTIYGINGGLDWSINRYVNLNADASYSKTKQAGSSTIDNVVLGLGLTLRR